MGEETVEEVEGGDVEGCAEPTAEVVCDGVDCDVEDCGR